MQHDFVACVVGLSNNSKEPFGTRPGVGKSCLCFRFAYPGYDGYVDSHPSVLAMHEFASPVINNTHFLYWGSPKKTYSAKGSEISVRFHLLEHTVFYQDITSHPFNPLTRPDEVNYYLKRIIGSIESAGKHSYYSRDEILGTSAAYKKLQYPANLSKQVRGYVVVFDVSLAETELEMQYKRVVPILEFLYKTKRKFVLAATKRDVYKIMSLEKLHELQKKFHVPLIETSANENLNVDEVFRVLAKHVLGRKASHLPDQIQSYDEAARCNLQSRGAAKRAFMTFLKKDVVSCEERLDPIQQTEAYKQCVQRIGSYQTSSLFVHYQLGLYNTRVDSYAGVMGDPELRREFLEGFVDSRHEMKQHKTELRKWIENYIRQLEPVTPPSGASSAAASGDEHSPVCDSSEQQVSVEPYHMFHPASKVAQEEAKRKEKPEAQMSSAVTTVPEPEGSMATPSIPDELAGSDDLDDHDYLNFDPKNLSLCPMLEPKSEFELERPPSPEPPSATTQLSCSSISLETAETSLAQEEPTSSQTVAPSPDVKANSKQKDSLETVPPVKELVILAKNGIGTPSAEEETEHVNRLKATSPPLVLPKPGKERLTQSQNSSLPSPSISKNTTHPLQGLNLSGPPTQQNKVRSATSSLSSSPTQSPPSTPLNKPLPPVRKTSLKAEECSADNESSSAHHRCKTEASDGSEQVSVLSNVRANDGVNSTKPAENKADNGGLGSPMTRKPSRVAPPPPAGKRVFSQKPKIPGGSPILTKTKNSTPPQSPILSPVHGVANSSSPGPTSPAAAGVEGSTVLRPKLSMIRQKIAEKKEAEGARETQSETGGTGGTSRLAEIRKRLATQKKGVVESESVTGSNGLSQPPSRPAPYVQRTPPSLPASSLSPTFTPPLPPHTQPSVPPKPTKQMSLPESSTLASPPVLPTRSPSIKPKPKPRSTRSDYFNVEPRAESGVPEPAAVPRVPAVPTIPKPAVVPKGPVSGTSSVEKLPKKNQPSSAIEKTKNLLGWNATTKDKSPKRTKVSPKKVAEKSAQSKRSPEKASGSRANFLNMKVRPLPPLPGHDRPPDAAPDHDINDYEQFSLGTMDDLYANYPQPPRNTSIRRWSSFDSNDVPSLTPRLPAKDIPDYIDGYVNTDNVPAPSRGPVGIDRRPLPRIPVGEEQEKPKVEEDDEEEVERNYDYPDLRGAIMFRSLPATKEWLKNLEKKAKAENIPKNIAALLTNSAQARLGGLKDDSGLIRTYSNASSDYVPMEGAEDGERDYVNTPNISSWIPPRNKPRTDSLLATTLHEMPEFPLTAKSGLHLAGEKRYAADDISIYMNLPAPEKLLPLPERHSNVHATLPRPREKPVSSRTPELPRKDAFPELPGKVAPSQQLPASESSNVVSPQDITSSPSPPPKTNPTATDPVSTISDMPTPPATLPKPALSTISPLKVSKVDSEGTEPPQGWPSPLHSQSELDADYQNIDCSQSLPLSIMQALAGQRPEGGETAKKLPPRNIKRQIT